MRPHLTSRHGASTLLAAAVALVAAVGVEACGGSRGKPAAAAARPARAADASQTSGNTAVDSQWNSRPVGRVEDIFEGRFPGVYVTQAAGGIAVRIRGQSTVNGNTDPLYVIDGFPVNAGPGGIVSINPQDIKRIEVLKTASQLAEYGVRGGNGVVKITTKQAGR